MNESNVALLKVHVAGTKLLSVEVLCCELSHHLWSRFSTFLVASTPYRDNVCYPAPNLSNRQLLLRMQKKQKKTYIIY